MDKIVTRNPVFEYLFQEAELIFLVLDQDGYVIEANKYAKNIVGTDLLNSKLHFYKLLVDFGNLPPFYELIQNGSVTRMLNITTDCGLPQTYSFNFYEEKNSILVFGQINHIETEALRENLLTANQEINNLSRELHKSNAQLTKLNSLKNQFLGMAAHDLRNPIGVILQYSEFLIDETKSLLAGKQLELLIRIKDSSKFMLRLLNDLLDISKIESGRLELDLRLTDFVSFVKRNVLVNQVLAAKKQIELSFQGEKNLPRIMIDQSKIEQVLNNLISNSIKYSFPNTIVKISVLQREDYIMVSVHDEGQGIPENELSKLFQAFQTTSVKSTDNERSTGLGLMIAKKIITGHRGKIWVDSKVGKGSTFFFSLPVPEEAIKNKHHVSILNTDGMIALEKLPEKQNNEPIEQINNTKIEWSPYLDQTIIDQYREIDPDLLKELITIFLEQSPSLMGDLQEVVNDENWKKMDIIADQLRGASANLGAFQLEQLYNEIIKSAKGKNISDYTIFFSRLNRLYESTKQALQDLIFQNRIIDVP